MGLVPGFVFSVNRRALLAVLAIGVSVSYALVAGAATGGLNEAQDALASGLSDTDLVAVREHGARFGAEALDPQPDVALAVANTSEHTFYTTRLADPPTDNRSRALVGPSSSLVDGHNVTIRETNLTVTKASDPPKGASPSWLGVHPDTFADLGGPDAPTAHVAVYEDPAGGTQQALEEQGFIVSSAPGAFPFYTEGAEQLVSAVRVTVVASALVVALLTGTVVSMELRAKRSSFSTLQVYAGSGLVRRLVAGRGAVLLTAGHLVGIGVTVGLLFALQRAGAARLALPTGYLVTALGATFGGGFLGLAWPVRDASQPLRGSELGEMEEPRDLPSPLRLSLTSWRTVVPLAISAMILAGSLGVIFGAVDMPTQLFGTDDANVLADTSNNPLRGTAPAFLGMHMGKVDGFTASSPEIYAPTRVKGHPVMARGVYWPALTDMEPVRIVEGEPPSRPGHAVLGQRLAGTLDAGVGDELVVPSAYGSSVERVTVSGVASAPGLLGDELLVSLETGRELTGLGSDSVNIVRYRVDTQLFPNGTGTPDLPSGLEATRLEVEPKSPIPLQQATARVELVNFAEETRGRQLTLLVDGRPVGDAWAKLGPQQTGEAEIPFRVPRSGLLQLSVNPSKDVQTGEPAYEIDAREVVTLDRELEVTVTEADSGDRAGDVEVSLTGTTVRTASDGSATLLADEIGNHTLFAEGPEGSGARSLLVVRGEDLYRSRIVVRSVSGPSSVDDGTWSGAVVVENAGGVAHNGTVTVPVDGQPRNATELELPRGQSQRIPFETTLTNGVHQIGPDDASLTVTVSGGEDAPDDGNQTNGTDGDQTAGDGGGGGDGGDGDGEDGSDGGTGDGDGAAEDAEDIRELLQRRAQARQQDDEEDLSPLQAFLGDTFENFNAAVTVVTIATVFHAGLIGLVAVRRDVEENATTLGTMASVGADRRQLRRRALLEFGIVGTIAAVVGTAVGLGLVGFAASQGWIGGFGHALVPRTGLGFALRVGAVSLAVTLGAAVLAVERVRGRRLHTLMVEGPVRSARPPLSTLIGSEGADDA